MAELGQTTDPVSLIPGSPAAVDEAATDWRRRARLAEQTGVELRKMPAPEGWTGGGAPAFETRAQSVGARWLLVAEALDAAGAAMETYAAALRSAQYQAELAIDAWEEGEQATAAALARPVPGAGLSFDRAAHAKAAMTAGASDRARAVAILEEARAQLVTAGDTASAALRSAAEAPDVGADVWRALNAPATTADEAMALVSGLDAQEVTSLLSLRPELAGLIAMASPAAASAWWSALGSGARSSLISFAPDVIGNLEGLSYNTRNEANRIWLDRQIEQARAQVLATELNVPRWDDQGGVANYNDSVADAKSQLAALENIKDALTSSGGVGAQRFLISLTNDVPPLAAVAVGDPDAADNITVAVPGMGATTADMTGWTRSAADLQAAQSTLDPGRTHSVIAWIGYETPPVPEPVPWGDFSVLGTSHAEAGAARLDTTIEGLQTVRSDSTLNVLGHSYGATTSSMALADLEKPVDTFVSLGSAGLPPEFREASDLDAQEVYAGQAYNTPALIPGDQWAWVGRASWEHPVDPSNYRFGAEVFDVNGGDDGRAVTDHGTSTLSGDSVDGSSGSGYLDRGTQSLRNVALATTGQGDLVSRPERFIPRMSTREDLP